MMHLNFTVRFFFFQLALFTSYRNAPENIYGTISLSAIILLYVLLPLAAGQSVVQMREILCQFF
jgi:hypothetical protein